MEPIATEEAELGPMAFLAALPYGRVSVGAWRESDDRAFPKKRGWVTEIVIYLSQMVYTTWRAYGSLPEIKRLARSSP